MRRRFCGGFSGSTSLQLPSLAPPAPSVTTDELQSLAKLIFGRRLLVITGAGISTASGIPDYRSPNGSYSRGHKPIQHHEFVRHEAQRRRYWARSYVGYQYFSLARPNPAHRALANLEKHGFVHGMVTQNVDGLHTLAGQQRVIDLHGCIEMVECLQCHAKTPRSALQERLRDHNTEWVASLRPMLPTELRADGDSELSQAQTEQFIIPACEACGGILKPSVTFFGGSVPQERVQAAAHEVAAADAVLVVGSSLQVYSAFRLAKAAAEAAKPIAILNNGPT
jgi:NAD-dependent deacetylase sirtuin 4